MAKQKFSLGARPNPVPPSPPPAQVVAAPAAAASEPRYEHFGDIREFQKPIPASELDASSKALLKPLGYKEGDPVPADFATKLDAIRKEYDADYAAASIKAAEDGQRFNPKLRVIDIENLPAEAKAKAAEELEVAKALMVRFENGGAPSPVVFEQPKLVAQGVPQPVGSTSRPAAPVQATPSQIPASARPMIAPGSQEPLFDIGQLHAQTTGAPVPAAEAPKAEQPEAPKDEKPAETGTAAIPKHCHKCGWPTGSPYQAEVTEEDRKNFAMTFLGKRFYKKYKLYNGQVELVFRSLTSKEQRTVVSQIQYDGLEAAEKGMPFSEAEIWARAKAYRMSLSLHSISVNGGEINEVPTMDEHEFTPGRHETVLKYWVETFVDTYLAAETMYRAVQQHYGFFNMLENKLSMDF